MNLVLRAEARFKKQWWLGFWSSNSARSVQRENEGHRCEHTNEPTGQGMDLSKTGLLLVTSLDFYSTQYLDVLYMYIYMCVYVQLYI